jgi:hypothetical protein
LRRYWTEVGNPRSAHIARFAPEFDVAQVGTMDDVREVMKEVRRAIPSFLGA